MSSADEAEHQQCGAWSRPASSHASYIYTYIMIYTTPTRPAHTIDTISRHVASLSSACLHLPNRSGVLFHARACTSKNGAACSQLEKKEPRARCSVVAARVKKKANTPPATGRGGATEAHGAMQMRVRTVELWSACRSGWTARRPAAAPPASHIRKFLRRTRPRARPV